MAASDPRQSPGFRRRLLAARLFVWAERVWPAVWPAVGVAGLFLATSLLGLWYGLTTAPHAVLLALFAAGLAAALWRARQAFRFSDRGSGLARLERDSGVTHRPLRGLDDTLPQSVQDPLTQRLWALHRERLVASLSRLRLSPPRSALPARGPAWARPGPTSPTSAPAVPRPSCSSPAAAASSPATRAAASWEPGT